MKPLARLLVVILMVAFVTACADSRETAGSNAKLARAVVDSVLRTFRDACLRTGGERPGVVRWAHDHEVPGQPSEFVWTMDTLYGTLTLKSPDWNTCILEAQAVNPVGIETRLTGMLWSGAGTVTRESEQVLAGPYGAVHTMIYHVIPDNRPERFTITVITVEDAGGPYQASLEMKRVTP